MDPKPEKPLRLFVNPLSIWTDLAFKTGQALWASAHAAAVRANTTARVAVIPTDDAPGAAAKPAEPTLATAPAEAPRKARARVRQPSKAIRFKATRAKLRSKANGKRRARR
jgi:hypothetical protein